MLPYRPAVLSASLRRERFEGWGMGTTLRDSVSSTLLVLGEVQTQRSDCCWQDCRHHCVYCEDDGDRRFIVCSPRRFRCCGRGIGSGPCNLIRLRLGPFLF
jgi:hypothetical protein